MPVAASSQLIYVHRTVFDAGRTATYEAARLSIVAHTPYVMPSVTGADYPTLVNESAIYMRERGIQRGWGIAANDNGTFTLTLFGG